MEQLAARRAHNPKVGSSSLSPATKEKSVITMVTGFFVFAKITKIWLLCILWGDFGEELLQPKPQSTYYFNILQQFNWGELLCRGRYYLPEFMRTTK